MISITIAEVYKLDVIDILMSRNKYIGACKNLSTFLNFKKIPMPAYQNNIFDCCIKVFDYIIYYTWYCSILLSEKNETGDRKKECIFKEFLLFRL